MLFLGITGSILICNGNNIGKYKLTYLFLFISDEKQPESSMLADAESLPGLGPAAPRRL